MTKFLAHILEVVLTPIAAEGTPNVEQIVIADVNIDNLTLNRVSGTTIPLYDKRHDVYDNEVELVAAK